MKAPQRNNFLAFLLCTPLFVLYGAYVLNHTAGLYPTGFIQYDNVSYIAYAKQYLDADSFHIQYSNPFNDIASKPIYFQPHILFFAFLLQIGVPAGWILIPFSILCAFICFRLLISLYDFLMPSSKERVLSIWMFAWGGGLLCVAGALACLYLNQPLKIQNLFLLDPEEGWWGLNFGRSLYFTCEAYYHALFLGCIYTLLNHKWLASLCCLFVLSLSHPFTGIELIGIVCAWSLLETIRKKSNVPLWFTLGSIAVLGFHLYFYLLYLNQFAEHKSVSEQYTLHWILRYYRMIPAYCLVAFLTMIAIGKTKIQKFFSTSSNRLFACWFVVAFLLANHDLFMTARQPIHFTRGYIWTSLFLLGLPGLGAVFQYVRTRFKIAGVILFCCLFFSDNILWITNQVISFPPSPGSRYVSAEQKQLFQFLDRESSNRTLVVSSDENLAYLSAVYTKAYPFYSHMYTTPFASEKKEIKDRFFTQGMVDTSWLKREVIFVLKASDSIAYKALNNLAIESNFNTPGYMILRQKSK